MAILPLVGADLNKSTILLFMPACVLWIHAFHHICVARKKYI